MSRKHVTSPTNQQSHPVCRIAVLVLTAGILRYIIMRSKYQIMIANHVEVSTPLSSWKRVLEGAFLFDNNIDPYQGDLLHETPAAIHFYQFMLHNIFKSVNLLFIAFDLGTALLLYLCVQKYSVGFQKEYQDAKKFPSDVVDTLPKEDFADKVSMYVLTMALFNPYTVLGCVGCSTMGIHNFFLSLFLFTMMFGSALLSSLALAVCSSISFYPIILVLPLITFFTKVHKSIWKATVAIVGFVIFSALLTGYNSNVGRDFSFIKSVYGCILTVPDLQPNIGLFWYFFTEMFDHFRELFIYSFQINATILYLVPLTLTFRNKPFILTIALLFLVSIFKSYPCLSDIGFVLSLVPNFVYLYSYCQQSFVISVILLMTSCLAPVLWHLWIYCASANANFYFGVTLAYAISQIFLVTDILFAHTKWEFYLKHGKSCVIDGEKLSLSLE